MSGEPDQMKWRGVRPVDGIRGVWPSRNATRINRKESAAGVGGAVLYTVPAGKRLFIASSFIGTRLSADAGCSSYLAARNAGDTLQYFMYIHQFEIAGQMATGMPYLPALEAEAGWDIYLNASHVNLYVSGMFMGWLEDA